jgi:2-hydroxy-3-oxopropionate reductase
MLIMKIGFIGLGIMGKPMAKNLLKAGYEVVINARHQDVIDEMCKCGATSEATAKDVAKQSDFIITMLPNSPQVKEVVLGRDGIIEGIKKGAVLIDMSSIAPGASQEVAKALEAVGAEMIDAPVSGGEPKAVEGTLSIMAGGKKEVFDKCYDILMKMGTSAILCGDVGAGNTTKLANQIIVAVNIAAVSEALVLGTKAGVNPEVIYKAIRGGLAGSTVLDAKAPMMLDGNFKPGFKLELHLKDLTNAMETAKENGLELGLTNQVFDIVKDLVSEGKGQNDHSGIVQYYEEKTGVEVRK